MLQGWAVKINKELVAEFIDAYSLLSHMKSWFSCRNFTAAPINQDFTPFSWQEVCYQKTLHIFTGLVVRSFSSPICLAGKWMLTLTQGRWQEGKTAGGTWRRKEHDDALLWQQVLNHTAKHTLLPSTGTFIRPLPRKAPSALGGLCYLPHPQVSSSDISA